MQEHSASNADNRRSPRRWLLRLALAVACALPLLLLEAAVRIAPLGRVVSKALYYQQVDTPAYRVSEDPFLRYELRPGAEFSATHPHPYTIHVDRWGARGAEHPEPKAPGIFRVLAFGGSTMFGCNVNDDETIPARLQDKLNADASARRFEVWNFGASGYAPSQVARLALREVARHETDLVLVQLYNRGRRPFLLPVDNSLVDFTPYLDDADSVLENFPTPDSLSQPMHLDLMRWSALYRSLSAFLRIALDPSSGMDSMSDRGDQVSFREMSRLVEHARAQRIPVVFVTLPGFSIRPHEIAATVTTRDVIALDQPGREREFYQVHPPPHVLSEWSSMIARELNQRCLLGGCPGAPSTD